MHEEEVLPPVTLTSSQVQPEQEAHCHYELAHCSLSRLLESTYEDVDIGSAGLDGTGNTVHNQTGLKVLLAASLYVKEDGEKLTIGTPEVGVPVGLPFS